jgi:hypothetical protein
MLRRDNAFVRLARRGAVPLGCLPQNFLEERPLRRI